MPESYALVYTEDNRRIFVVMSAEHGAFILTKACKGSDCRCIGCSLFMGQVETDDGVFPILDLADVRELRAGLLVYTFTEKGELFLDALDRKSYADYRGPIGREQLAKLFGRPNRTFSNLRSATMASTQLGSE